MEAMNAYGLAEGYILTMEEKEELEIDGKQVHVRQSCNRNQLLFAGLSKLLTPGYLLVILKKVLDGCLYVLNLCIPCLQGVGPVNQEEGRNALQQSTQLAHDGETDGGGCGYAGVALYLWMTYPPTKAIFTLLSMQHFKRVSP